MLALFLQCFLEVACFRYYVQVQRPMLAMHSTLNSILQERLFHKQMQAWWSQTQSLCSSQCGCDPLTNRMRFAEYQQLAYCDQDQLHYDTLLVAEYQGVLPVETGLYLKKNDKLPVLWMPHISDFIISTVRHDDSVTTIIQLSGKSFQGYWIWCLP